MTEEEMGFVYMTGIYEHMNLRPKFNQSQSNDIR